MENKELRTGVQFCTNLTSFLEDMEMLNTCSAERTYCAKQGGRISHISKFEMLDNLLIKNNVISP